LDKNQSFKRITAWNQSLDSLSIKTKEKDKLMLYAQVPQGMAHEIPQAISRR
jgi:hypothetical protein